MGAGLSQSKRTAGTIKDETHREESYADTKMVREIHGASEDSWAAKAKAAQEEIKRLQEKMQRLEEEIERLKTLGPKEPVGQESEKVRHDQKNCLSIIMDARKAAAQIRADSKSKAEQAFSQMFREAADGVGGLTLEKLKHVVVASSDFVVMADSELEQLFAEQDRSRNGTITLEQFFSALKSRPSVGCLDGTMGLIKSEKLGILEAFATSMLSHLSERMRLPSSAKLDIQTVIGKLEPEDVRAAWRDAQEVVVAAVAAELKNLRSTEGSPRSAQELSAKYADDTFEAIFKDMPDFRSGVEGLIGLPGKDISGGIAMEFCNSEDSGDEFVTSNYNIKTTPKEEYDFVVNPLLCSEHPGERWATPLIIFLYAACARKANSDDEVYDAALESLDEHMRSGVKAVLVRRAKEVAMNKLFLATASSTDERLCKLAACTNEELSRIQNDMDSVLRLAEKDARTGQPRFDQLAAAIEERCGIAQQDLEALLTCVRRNLREARLMEEEVVALRLYTGPAFVKLNGTLRERDVGGKGNRYVCTIYAAISGMVKLAENTCLPESRVVYRGNRGMRLPERFWKPDVKGIKGGVEMAFLSTTTDVEVALGYAAEGSLPTIFAIQTGAVDRGAALGFLSQYPNESEILMPPRSFLEVVGEPSIMATSKGAVLCFPMKINCNLQCPMLEKLRESRKAMLVSTLEHVRKEVVRDVDACMQKEQMRERMEKDPFWRDTRPGRNGASFIESIKEEPQAALRAAAERPAGWYNKDVNFRRAMNEAMDVQRISMGKLELWLQDSSLMVYHLNPMSAIDSDRKASGRLRRLTGEGDERATEIAAGAAGGQDDRGAVLKLCKHLEFIHEHADERLPNGETALMKYAAEGYSEAVRLLLRAGADANAVREDGMTALMLTSLSGLVGIAASLVQHGGANVDTQDGVEGRTALIYAAESGHASVVRTLLRDCKADPWIKTSSGEIKGTSATARAAYNGHLEVIKVLHEENALDIHSADGCALTPLLNAAQNGHLAVVRFLVETAGADPNERYEGWWTKPTAAQYAALNEQHEVAEYLSMCTGKDLVAGEDFVLASGFDDEGGDGDDEPP